MNNFFNSVLQSSEVRIAPSRHHTRFHLDKNEQSDDLDMDLKHRIMESVMNANWNRYPASDYKDIESKIAEYCRFERDAERWGVPAFALVNLWVIGGTMMIYLAGLKGVPRELYDAAEVDGASPWQRFRHVTVPLISPTTFFLVIWQTICAFQLFTEPFVMTGGGPAQSSMPVVQYIYQNAFQFSRMGKASAIAWFLFIFIFGFTVLQNVLQRRWVHYETE